jgi:periplasmic divalent cation tolerance protein
MEESDEHQLVFCTCPDRESAQLIAEQLVGQKLAACVNILPGVISVYRWQGNIEESDEHMLVIKTVSDAFEELANTINELHPYELPEVIGVPIESGSLDYLNWISENTSKYLR